MSIRGSRQRRCPLLHTSVWRLRRQLRIRAEHAKDRETRVLPISSRLAGVLEMAKLDPAGKEYTPDAYVFGECGA